MRANILKLFTNKFAQKQKNPFAEPLYPKKNDARPLRKSSGTAWRPWGKTKKITARPERLPVTVRWYTHGESNPNRWNRNPLFYPLNYGCMAECGHKSTIIPDSILIIGQKKFHGKRNWANLRSLAHSSGGSGYAPPPPAADLCP